MDNYNDDYNPEDDFLGPSNDFIGSDTNFIGNTTQNYIPSIIANQYGLDINQINNYAYNNNENVNAGTESVGVSQFNFHSNLSAGGTLGGKSTSIMTENKNFESQFGAADLLMDSQQQSKILEDNKPKLSTQNSSSKSKIEVLPGISLSASNVNLANVLNSGIGQNNNTQSRAVQMFNQRKKRAERFQSVGYGQNEDEPLKPRKDYEQESDDELVGQKQQIVYSDDEEDDNAFPEGPSQIEIDAYDGKNSILTKFEKNPLTPDVKPNSNQLTVFGVKGKGTKLFEKQLQRMDRFTLDKNKSSTSDPSQVQDNFRPVREWDEEQKKLEKKLGLSPGEIYQNGNENFDNCLPDGSIAPHTTPKTADTSNKQTTHFDFNDPSVNEMAKKQVSESISYDENGLPILSNFPSSSFANQNPQPSTTFSKISAPVGPAASSKTGFQYKPFQSVYGTDDYTPFNPNVSRDINPGQFLANLANVSFEEEPEEKNTLGIFGDSSINSFGNRTASGFPSLAGPVQTSKPAAETQSKPKQVAPPPKVTAPKPEYKKPEPIKIQTSSSSSPDRRSINYSSPTQPNLLISPSEPKDDDFVESPTKPQKLPWEFPIAKVNKVEEEEKRPIAITEKVNVPENSTTSTVQRLPWEIPSSNDNNNNLISHEKTASFDFTKQEDTLSFLPKPIEIVDKTDEQIIESPSKNITKLPWELPSQSNIPPLSQPAAPWLQPSPFSNSFNDKPENVSNTDFPAAPVATTNERPRLPWENPQPVFNPSTHNQINTQPNQDTKDHNLDQLEERDYSGHGWPMPQTNKGVWPPPVQADGNQKVEEEETFDRSQVLSPTKRFANKPKQRQRDDDNLYTPQADKDRKLQAVKLGVFVFFSCPKKMCLLL